MNKKPWYVLWGSLYIICAALGFVTQVTGFLKVLCVFLALCFFVPPAMLLYDSIPRGDKKTVRRVRNLRALSLAMTMAVMVINLLCAAHGSRALGDTLYAVLVLVSSPMYCIQNGILSLFFWACLLMVGIRHGKKK